MIVILLMKKPTIQIHKGKESINQMKQKLLSFKRSFMKSLSISPPLP